MSYIHMIPRRAFYSLRHELDADGLETGRFWVAFADDPDAVLKNDPATAPTYASADAARAAYDFVTWEQPSAEASAEVVAEGWG